MIPNIRPSIQRANIGADLRLPIHDCDILVVEDVPWNRHLIGTILTGAGFTRVRYANDGQDALDAVAVAIPDLVVLDIMMPRMDGFEVCRHLRAAPETAELPILIQTALTSTDDRNQAFQVGSTDLVVKPLDQAELIARVRIHLENHVLIRDLQLFRARLEGELEVARTIYQDLLPGADLIAGLQASHGVVIRSQSRDRNELGGRLWGVKAQGPERLSVYLLDIPGRSISAALNACQLHTLIGDLLEPSRSPGSLLTELNGRACRLEALGDIAFVAIGTIEPANGRFTYATAGDCRPIVIHADHDIPVVGETANTPFGVVATTQYEDHGLSFGPGATLLLGTPSSELTSLLTAAIAGVNGPARADAVAGVIAETCGGKRSTIQFDRADHRAGSDPTADARTNGA